MRRLAFLAAGLPLFAACTHTDTTVTAVESATFATAAEVAERCGIEFRTISTAIEAHYAQYQVDVASMTELVPEMLREAPADWHLVVDDESGIPIATANTDGRCADFDPGTALQAQPIDDIAVPPSVNPISQLGFPCYMQQSILVIAVDALEAETGVRATSQDTLVAEGLLPVAMDLYVLDDGGAPVPLFPGECHVIVDDPSSEFADADPACSIDAIRLIFASDTFQGYTGAAPTSVAEIGNRGYLAEPIVHYDLDADGDLVSASPLGCPPIHDTTADACSVELRTLETAIEAFFAQNGVDASSSSDLIPDYLLEPPRGWQPIFSVDGDGGSTITIEVIPGGPCDV